MTYGRGKSDRPIVPEKPANKAHGAPRVAERVEGRGLAKGNLRQQNKDRTQRRDALQSKLERIRQAARRDKKLRFTTLWHHVYEVDRLREAYFTIKRKAAPGIDGETWEHYGEDLEENLRDLSDRLKRGAYRAKPVRRVFIPKADGRQRPLGVPALEDKIVQGATVAVLNAIYETDFVWWMGSECVRRKARRRVVVSAHCLPIFTSIMCSTSGPSGGGSRRPVM